MRRAARRADATMGAMKISIESAGPPLHRVRRGLRRGERHAHRANVAATPMPSPGGRSTAIANAAHETTPIGRERERHRAVAAGQRQHARRGERAPRPARAAPGVAMRPGEPAVALAPPDLDRHRAAHDRHHAVARAVEDREGDDRPRAAAGEGEDRERDREREERDLAHLAPGSRGARTRTRRCARPPASGPTSAASHAAVLGREALLLQHREQVQPHGGEGEHVERERDGEPAEARGRATSRARPAASSAAPGGRVRRPPRRGQEQRVQRHAHGEVDRRQHEHRVAPARATWRATA